MSNVPPRSPMKRKRSRTQKSVRASCDKLWSQLVRSEGICERCKQDGRLEAHHVYGRGDFRLRFEPRNGVALCHQCHRWAESFPIEFARWFEMRRTDDFEFLMRERIKGPLKRTFHDFLRLEAALKAELATLEREAA